MVDMTAGFRLRLAWGFLASGPPDRRQIPLRAMLRAIATRRRLRELDDRMLRDIGIDRAEALAEARRAPWDLAPARHDGER